MVPGNPSLRSLRRWRAIANDKVMSSRIPYARFVDPGTIATKNGDLVKVFRLAGLPFETMDERGIETARNLLATFYAQNGDERTGFYLHTIRRRVRPDDLPDYGNAAGFAGYVAHIRHHEMARASLFHIEHYLTVVRRPAMLERAGNVVPFLTRRKASEDEWLARRHETMRALENITLGVSQLLGRYDPQPMRLDASERPELLSFLSLLANGVWSPVGAAEKNLDTLIPTHRSVFRGETIELRGAAPEDTRYAAMVALKGYAEETWSGCLNAMLGANAEFIATQSFTPKELTATLDRIKWAQRTMEVGGDEAQSLSHALVAASDDVSAGREIYGDHHLSIAVLADEEGELANSVSGMSAVLTAANLRPVREDVALEALWWAQMPGNEPYRIRKAMISSSNFADFGSAHNHVQGHRQNLRWKEPVALLETTSGTPYWFSFHAPGANANGSTAIFGPSGAGKTALVNYLVTSAMLLPQPPRIYYFDKDRGAEAVIRALGGEYTTLRPDTDVGFNPFRTAIDERGVAWLREWIAARVGGTLTPLQDEAIVAAVRENAQADPDLQRFQHFAQLFNAVDDSGAISAALSDWHASGARSWLFDAEEDGLDLRPNLCGFDMTALLADEKSAESFVDYLFYRLDRALEDGVPTIICLDEAWRLLRSGRFALQIEDWLKTIRKKDGLVVFITQEPEDAARSEIAPAIIGSTATKIYFPNETADEATYRDTFGLTAREFDLVRDTPRERRSFLVKQGVTAAFVRFDLSSAPEVLKVLSGSAESLRELDALRADDAKGWLRPFMGV